MTKKRRGGQVEAKAVINNIKIGSLPSLVFDRSGSEIIPYGLDNLYPQRIFEAIAKSPTGGGCVKRLKEFVFGLGVDTGGATVVNRNNETLNDVLDESVQNYAKHFGFAIHFNFNIFGQITEMTSVDIRYIRKDKDLAQAIFGEWGIGGRSFMQDEQIEIDLYDHDNLKKLIDRTAGGFKDYKGQLLYFSADHQIYPTAPIDSASVSANYELEAQVYPYANVKNGFSGNTIIKIPGMMMGEESQEELGSNATIQEIDQVRNDVLDSRDEILSPVSKLEGQLESMHGAENSGSSLVVQVPVGVSGEFKDFKMVENLTPTNVDALFVNQNEKAENDILKVFTMPKILLGVSDGGMFNEASFNDAFNYKNADTEGDRITIERVFNSFLPRSVFGVNSINIVPLKMKGGESV